ncbi:MAG TPA: hypothetical protein VHW45_19590 [Candidatus Sulfotelmatobacter sp.]|nr:hypothetical protein [Candidatus Sulfotelmatobacter sp.]
MLRWNRQFCQTVFVGALVSTIFVPKPAAAQQLSEPVSNRKLNIVYWTVLGTASAAVAFDAYTTVASIGPGKRCNVEVESPALYGRIPTPARTIAVMGAQLGSAIFLSRQLRHSRDKNMRHLTLFLAAANGVHFAGAIHNERVCR